MVFRVLTDVLPFNFVTIPSLARRTEIWIDVWCWMTFENHSSHIKITFISHYIINLVCVSIILAHMLASLDCVSRQECWEPFLPKHLQHDVLSPQRRQPLKHWRVNQATESALLTNEQRSPERWSMTWRRHPPSSTTCCHMINKKELVSSHHQPPQTWQSLPPKVFQVCIMMNTLASRMFEIKFPQSFWQ
jgi:hypothetical protein